MSRNLEELLNWFPSGTAEGEKAILERVFVYVDEFANVMSPPTGNPHLLIGNKGSGKSAIIDFALRVLDQQAVPNVLLTPFDIPTGGIGPDSSTGDMARTFHGILLNAIAGKLSESSTGWFDGAYAALYQEAVASGQRSPDFAGRMGRFFSEIAKPIAKIDLNAAFPHLTKITKNELEKAIGRALNKKSFYLFIDDTDQIADPDKPGHLNRIWSLLLAVRRLTSYVPEVKAVVSLRSEVWRRLQVDPSGQRDQTDHFSSLCVILRSSRELVTNIIERRLQMAADTLRKPGVVYYPFFKGNVARAPYSEEMRSWKDLIVVRSRERPRDAIQMINLLSRRAIEGHKELIDEATFQNVMPVFSESVAKQFAQEVVLECPVAMEILRTFATIEFDSGSFSMSAEQALSHFRMVISKFSVKLYGIVRSQTNEGDIFELWRFFYLSGVLNARVSDSSKKDGYRHLDPETDALLVAKSRWNDLQKILWEVNTVYRDFLIAVEAEDRSKTGLPYKKPRKSRR